MPSMVDSASDERIKEIKSVLRSLLISNSKLDVTVQHLNRLYREEEGRYIPFKDFRFNTLEDFLLHMPDTLRLQYNHQNQLCVRHVDTEKTVHISSLVARQKKPLMKKSKSMYNYKPRYTAAHSYYKPTRHDYNYSPVTSTILLQALQELKRSPSYSTRTCGLRKSEVMTKVKEKLGRYCTFTIQNLNSELFKLSHLLLVEGDFIYFKDDLAKLQESKKQENRATEKSAAYNGNKPINYASNNEQVRHNHQNVNKESSNCTTFSSQKESGNHIQNNNIQRESINYTQSNNNYTQSNKSNTLPKAAANHIQVNNTFKESCNQIQEEVRKFQESCSQIQEEVNKELTKQVHDEFSNNICSNSESSLKMVNETHTNYTESLTNGFSERSQPEETNSSDVIKERTKIRLQKLIEKHPEGIWCAELPNLYKSEYNVTLEYEDAGFNSITEFVAALPDIFQIVEPIPNTNRLMLLDAKNPEGKPNNSHQTKTLASLYNFDEYVAGEPEPIPFKLSSNVSQKLLPEGVMNYNETVDQIRVSSLIQDDYIEVVISEIFTPSFFWVHLRKSKKKLKTLMDNLDEFYKTTSLDYYKIPQILLQPGLNIACVYAKMWHRGIVRKIKPDGYIVILFYDYGTVKTYHPDDLYFLNKKFSYLPSQAIACGLYNVKPAGGNIEWPQAAIDEFNHRVWNVPLVALICNTNEENNTITINLIDTSDDLTDFHVSDWMVENEFAQHGKMEEVPYNRLLMYDEDTIIRVMQNQAKPKKKNKDLLSVDLPLLDTRESCISPNPSSNYIDSTYDATHVATLVKENMDLTKQTNTIAQAILLNMPINRSADISDSNLDLKNVRDSKDYESQETGDDLYNAKLDDKFSQDLKNSLGTIKVSISEMNNNYYGSEFIKNDPMQLKLPIKEIVDNKSVLSLFSNAAKSESKKEQSNSNHSAKETITVPLKQSVNVNNERRPSVQSINSNHSNFDSRATQEDTCDEDEDLKYNGSIEHDRFTIKSGTVTFEKVEPARENPKVHPINIKYPTKFAESYCNKEIENKSKNVNEHVNGNVNSNHHEESLNHEDEGYGSKYASSQSNSNLRSTSPVTNISATSTISTSTFTVTYLSERCKKKAIHMFHLDNEGWICTNEIVDAFTNLKDQRVMLKLLQILEYNVNFKNLLRDTHPDLFSQLDKSVLKAPRDENKKIVEDFVLILMPLQAMLQVLVKLDFLSSKMLKEAISMMKQARENIEHVLYELYNNRILYDVLNLLFQYKKFKRSLRLKH